MHDTTHTEATRSDPQADGPTVEHDAAEPQSERTTVEEVTELVSAGVRDQMQTRPYVTMAAAFGLGYVLGGGVPKFMVRAAAAAGLRYAAVRFIRSVFPNDV